ncbi:MAG: branched-chain amino acid transaminase [Rhodothermales bacterium]|nr:branched-chain amino acid transaminase [Rhodothermales bacterium]
MRTHDVWFNGQLVPFDQATVPILTHALHYGSSVFEGIRCYKTDRGSAVFRLSEHMQRLIDSAKIYRMEIPYTLDELNQAVLDTVSASGLDACYIRPLVYRGFGGKMGVNPLGNPVEVAIAVWEWGKYLGPEALEQGVDVQVATWNRYAPNTLPAMAKAGGNYLNSSLIKMEAVLNGFEEGIALTTEGLVSEGSGENLFLVKGGVVYTTPAAQSILTGITRASVMTLLKEQGVEVREQAMPRELLYLADELFFTGTAAEVTPIRSVDRYTVGEGRRGPITERVQRAFLDVVETGNDPHGWLTFLPAGAASGDGATRAAEPAV